MTMLQTPPSQPVDSPKPPRVEPVVAPPATGRQSESPPHPNADHRWATSPADRREAPARPGRIRQLFKLRKLKHYNRLVWLVAVVNLAAGARLLAGWDLSEPGSIDPAGPANLVVINLTVAVLIRQQYVVNALFWLATRAPTSWPLPVRWTLGKVYHFGGIHSSTATAAVAWFLIQLAATTAAMTAGNSPVTLWEYVLSFELALLLLVILYTAMPFVRQKHHDRFERTHRWGGWTALALFWILTVVQAARVGSILTYPAVWALAAATFSVALPWMRLKKVEIDIDSPSDHVALTTFDYGYTPFAGSSTAVSRDPLREWHSFANVPVPGQDGFKLTISRAGDWTGDFIDDKPEKVWVKGIATAGVANIEVLFSKVVYVATGSGIGPCLPHLFAQEVPAHLIWATRNPIKTYGEKLVGEILDVQPDALIWDTDAHGKPDMVELAYEAVLATGAEAVICISNSKLTWQVVEGIEQRGIPAYGAIWDS